MDNPINVLLSRKECVAMPDQKKTVHLKFAVVLEVLGTIQDSDISAIISINWWEAAGI